MTIIKKGIIVKVLAGKDKGKSGKVIKIDKRYDRVMVEGLNIVKKHVAPKQTDPGGIKEIEAYFDLSNIAISKGVKMLCFPENALLMPSSKHNLLSQSFSENQNPGLKFFTNLAKKNNIWVLVGSLSIKVSKDKVVNRSYLIDNYGKIACDLLCISGGWSPTVHLFTQSRGCLLYTSDAADE